MKKKSVNLIELFTVTKLHQSRQNQKKVLYVTPQSHLCILASFLNYDEFKNTVGIIL